VQVDVYNVKGQKVHSLLNEVKNSGRHSIAFEARDDSGRALSSGVYFYRFTAGKYRATRKMLLME
jgi:flagellar hook assembly protein FlgD